MGTKSPGTVQKTKYMLSGALMRLLKKRSFQRISVGDLCQEAMVSRSAFYVHFEDKYDLMRFTLEYVMKTRAEELRGISIEERMIYLLAGVQENRLLIEHLLTADMSRELLEIVTGTIQQTLEDWMRQSNLLPQRSDEEIGMAAAFCAGGMANTIMCWIRGNFALSKEEIARCQSELLMRILTEAQIGRTEREA
ncbi:MAG: TetR family transcriptional regulator [Clostridia bacterium]|nr:TetR family transcriptional regulator [Clostridia bacterium]